MKYASDRPFADPEKAARKLIEIANSAEAYMDGGSRSRQSTGRSCSRTEAAPPNTVRASPLQ
jgi:hypothetical protein